jgi:hypothetical protein
MVLEYTDAMRSFSTPSLKNATSPGISPFLGKNGRNAP